MSDYKPHTPENPPVEQGTYLNVEHFFMKNRIAIIAVLGILVVGIGGYFGYKKIYMEPRQVNASNSIAGAEGYFMKDSVDLALNGDGTSMGFLTIIDKYGATDAGNISHFYAGVCFLKKADLDNAIKQLEAYKPGTDEIAGKTYELLGHAYADKKDYTKAIGYYKKAGDAAKNVVQSPVYYKFAGDLMLEQNDAKGALEMYKLIKKDYPQSQEGQNIDLDIAYTETKLGM